MATKFSRRAVLVGIGVTAASGLLAACAAPAQPTAAPKPAAAPTTAPAAAAPTTAPAAAKPTEAPKAAEAPKPTEAPKAAAPTAAAQPAAKAASGSVRWQNRGADYEIKASTDWFNGDFKKQNPNINLTIEPAPDGRDEKLVTAMVGGNAPDIFESWSDNVTQFADKGQVLDVEPLVKRDFTAKDLEDFYPWQWRDFVLPSKIRFGLPKYVNVMCIWYNKEMFDKAGLKPPDDTWTHDTYREAAIKLTTKKGDQIDVFGLHYPIWSWDRFWYKVEAWGGLTRDAADDTKATFDSEEALAAFEWSRKLLWDDKAMAQRLLLLGTGTSYNAQALFASGRFAMNEDGFYPFSMAKTINKQIKWAWAEVPKGPKQKKVLGTTDGWCVWKGSKAQDAAWEVTKALASKGHQDLQSEQSGRLPVRFSALASWKDICVKAYPELADANIDIGKKILEGGYAGNRQFFKKDAEARQVLVPALEKVYVTGNTPVTYFKDIAAQITKQQKG